MDEKRRKEIVMKASLRSQGWLGPMLLVCAVVAFAAVAHAEDPVTVTVEITGDEVPGGDVTATAVVEATDGSTVESYAWTQVSGLSVAAMTGAASDTAVVTLGSRSEFRNYLLHVLAEPPITEAQLPENVPLPVNEEGEFPGGLQNRFVVAASNPFALEEAAVVMLEVEVVTSSGTYHGEAEIDVALPYAPATGLQTVPIGVPVLLHGKDQTSYDWALTSVPAGSSAALADATTQNPEFTPDISGVYTVQVTELPEEEDKVATTLELMIHAGTWRGVIIGQDADGRPVADGACTGCHNDGIAPDKFTPWSKTGHAEIFSDNLDTSTHYSSSCFSCHTVGFNTSVANGGFDDAADYQDFIDAGLLNNPGDNWTTVLAEYDETAKKANIQCENCHGPQDGAQSHGPYQPEGEPRVSISADVCGSCHGEPARHGRYQQWQLSGHANYELAIDEGNNGSCARCHTGNGFLAWLPVLLDDDPTTDPTANVTVNWSPEETHPQTCATCHDPHAIGTTTGEPTNATVRISGNTPPLIAGFKAVGVGRGAICMTCHNTRRGLYNDKTWDSLSASDKSRAPHLGAQADVLMGQNAFFVDTGKRGPHSFVRDTCVRCHMEETPPPADLSYNLGGTNHTFYASNQICAECHSEVSKSAPFVQEATEAALEELKANIEEAALSLVEDLVAEGNTIDLDGEATIDDASTIADVEFGESHGRQAFSFTFTDMSTVGPIAVSSIDVIPAGAADSYTLVEAANPNLLKAGWNYNLIHSDGSLGVHNPGFIFGALDMANGLALDGVVPGSVKIAAAAATGTCGETVTVPVSLETVRSVVSSVEVDVQFSQPLSFDAATIGAAANAAGKQLEVDTIPGGIRLSINGSSSAIDDGVLANLSFAVPTGWSGTYTVSLASEGDVVTKSGNVATSCAVAACTGPYTYWTELAAHNPGQFGSQWRTDLFAKDVSGNGAAMELTLHTSRSDHTINAVVPATGTAVLEDIVGVMDLEGQGTLEICASNPLDVISRTYNQAEEGSFGQFLDSYVSADGLSEGQTASLLGLRQREDLYRSHIFVTNTGSTVADVSINLFAATGALLKTYTLSVAPGKVILDQDVFAKRANQPNLGWGYAEVEVVAGSGVIASATVLDSQTNDGTTIPMKR